MCLRTLPVLSPSVLLMYTNVAFKKQPARLSLDLKTVLFLKMTATPLISKTTAAATLALPLSILILFNSSPPKGTIAL